MINTIHSKKNFYTLVERERARSDRTGSYFSIIILSLPHKSQISIKTISPALTGKLHCYDDIGWIDKKTIGILMPYTSCDDAAKLAVEIAEASAHASVQCGHHVLTYPLHWVTSSALPTAEKNSEGDATDYANVTAWARANDKLMKYLKLSPHIPLWKKLADILGAGTALVLLLPVLLMLFLYIKIVSPGPAFFRQKRVGFLGRSFVCYKFRTMHAASSVREHNKYFSMLMSKDVPMQKLDDHDSRIIPFGTLLRKAGLDELPQLFNVLKGDMSLIGPRPCIPYEAEEYKIWQRKRFDALPGLTGLWQVSGKNRTTFNQMMRYDIHYAVKRNFSLDVKILFKTIPAIIDQVAENRGIKVLHMTREKT
jgi:lipopolysaccharide/colanic/teichoic acid biosynthesis glycosyltransferase